MVGRERGRRREERKPGYRNYCGSETCATAAYLNEDRENAGRQVGEGKEWRRDRENEKEEAGTGERKRDSERKIERRNYRTRGERKRQIIISGPAESPNN